MFEEHKDLPTETLKRLVHHLELAKIPFAVMGGMAVRAHGHKRMTGNVDLLLTSEGLEQFRDHFVPEHYEPNPGKKRRFADRRSGIPLKIYLAGHFPGIGQQVGFPFSDPAEVRTLIGEIFYVRLETRIRDKLAARRFQDLADVVELIRANQLDDSFAQRLHSSVRRDFLGCIDETRREEEFLARNG